MAGVKGKTRAAAAIGALVAGILAAPAPAAAYASDVPVLGQRDPAWAALPLGTDPHDTIGSAGCALTAVAMVQRHFGTPTDPKSLNRWLVENDGYLQDDLMLWRQAMVATGGKVRWKWRHIEDLSPLLRTAEQDDAGTPTAEEARAELDAGNLVVAEVTLHGHQHFVVLTGYRGTNFFINDPWFADRATLNARYGPYERAVLTAHVFFRAG